MAECIDTEGGLDLMQEGGVYTVHLDHDHRVSASLFFAEHVGALVDRYGDELELTDDQNATVECWFDEYEGA